METRYRVYGIVLEIINSARQDKVVLVDTFVDRLTKLLRPESIPKKKVPWKAKLWLDDSGKIVVVDDRIKSPPVYPWNLIREISGEEDLPV